MTLIELLVVVLIVMIIAGATIPRLKPAMEKQRVREAARSLNLYLNMARTVAMSDGRPCGLRFDRLTSLSRVGTSAATSLESRACVTVSQVEVPAPYSGDQGGSTLQLAYAGVSPGPAPGYAYYYAVVSAGDFSTTAGVKYWDQVQIGGQGPLYQISGPTNITPPAGITVNPTATVTVNGVATSVINITNSTNQWLLLCLDVSSGQQAAWPAYQPPPVQFTAAPVPFSVFRQPTKTTAPPLDLAVPAIIDLSLSGTDPDPGFVQNVAGQMTMTGTSDPTQVSFGPESKPVGQPVIVTFGPGGSLDRIYYNGGYTTGNGYATQGFKIASQPVYFLVGKRDKLPPAVSGTATDSTNTAYDPTLGGGTIGTNLDDTTNLWVAVNPRTGMVTTTEMATPPTGYTGANKIMASRAIARLSSLMRGQ
jgi:type II secretory pathway pseudopilin PulG